MRSCLMGVAALALASAYTDAPAAEDHGAYAAVNGIRMYYESYGPARGVPLLLLHGGGSTIDVTFGRILPFLARDRRVIAVEEQAHGRTSDRDAPLSFATSADDVAALLDQLHIEQADVFGFSNGASVGLQIAIRHPRAVRKLVFASSMTKKHGAQPQLWKFMQKRRHLQHAATIEGRVSAGQPGSGQAQGHARQGRRADASLPGRARRGSARAACASR